MNRRFSGAVVTALIGLIPIMLMGDAPKAGESGIEGIISVSPSRPGPIRKDQPNSAPARDVEFVVKKDEAQVTSFTTNAEGSFRVAVPPGHYTVLREDAGSRVGRWRFEVDVVAGEVAKVNWTADSGMR